MCLNPLFLVSLHLLKNYNGMKKIYNSMIKSLALVGFFAMLVLSGCQKDSTEGPQGEKGEQGIAGADGSTLLSGNGAPTTSLGKNGDYYLDKTAVAIYGPKTSAGWGEATSLKGETGNNGKDGSKILSGTDVPASSLGAEGDFYFDTQNIAIYGPKTTVGWGSPVSLKASAANGVTVLLYRNHAFQRVVKNEMYTYEAFDFESIISLDSKYHDIYENGLVATYIKKSGDIVAGWGDYISSYFSSDDKGFLVEIKGYNFVRNQIEIYGSSRNMTESEVKAAKIDIKIVLIPATTVEVMSSKKINTKDLKAVAKYLGI